jgi:hypothetical protein
VRLELPNDPAEERWEGRSVSSATCWSSTSLSGNQMEPAGTACSLFPVVSWDTRIVDIDYA